VDEACPVAAIGAFAVSRLTVLMKGVEGKTSKPSLPHKVGIGTSKAFQLAG